MNSIIDRSILLLYTLVMSSHLPRRKGFTWRCVLSLAILLCAVGFFCAMELMGAQGIWLDMGWLLLCSGALALSYVARPVLYLFWALAPVGVMGVANSFRRLLFFLWTVPSWAQLVVTVLIDGLVGCFGYILLVWLPVRPLKKQKVGRGLFVGIVALLMSLFGMVNSADSGALSPWELLLFRAMLSLLALLMLYIFEMEHHLRDDYEMLTELLEKDKIRYEVSKEYTDLINMKFHDIKHQIHKMKTRQSIDPAYLEKLENAIRQYDSDLHTGNEALDIILTEKSRLCAEKNIETTIIADGSALSFVSAADIYSIFGNILDNAIEASEKLPEEDMKQISLVAQKESGVLRIRVTNFFAEAPKSDGVGYATTKKDAQAHGFGIKSVQYIVEKYGGVVRTEVHDNVFTMNIVLPIL